MSSCNICIVDMDMSKHGGVERVSANLANGLAKYYTVFLLSCCSRAEDKSVYPLKEKIVFKNLELENGRIRRMLPSFFRKLKEVCDLHDINVVILQGHYLSFLGVLLRFFTKTKVVCFDHGSIINQWNDKKAVVMRVISAALCNRLVTLTERNRDDYIKLIPSLKNKIYCIYNWSDVNKDNKFTYNIDSKCIISAGRFTEEKGFDRLIEIFARVVEKHPDWEMDLFGDGPMKQTIENSINIFSIKKNVHLRGMVNNLCDYYKDYSFYVLPSYREGMPMTLLEAKSNWLPIVSFDILTGPREIVQDGINGILVPSNDIEKFAEAICHLIENSQLRYSMAVHAQDNMELFLKNNIVNKWISLINGIT